MEHYKEGQYDDDLTVGIDEYDEDFSTGDIDLFDYVGDEESPLARLKSIILSIDWEITDEILRQFNEELLDLKDIWHGNKVNLIYVQALEKISRYIYKEKSSAHPNAIKLLLTFYANLEKIVSDEEMSDESKKEILLEDVQRFEILKKQIAPSAETQESQVQAEVSPAAPEVEVFAEESVPDMAGDEESVEPALIEENSAILPTDDPAQKQDLEVGEAGKADPLLNLKAIVYGIDWEITDRDLSNLSREVKVLEEEFQGSKAKTIFLQGIGSIGAYINLKRSDAHADAFKLLHSFYTGLETVVRKNLTGQAEKDVLLPLVDKFNIFKTVIADTISPEAMAKSPVSEEDGEAGAGEIQPAFADVPDDVSGFKEEEELAALEEKEPEAPVDVYFDDDAEAEDEAEDSELASEMESRLSGMFEEPDESATKGLDADIALQGVDVETEADDDSEEEPLPEEGGEFAPALAAEEVPADEESPAVFADKVDDFFDDPDVDEGPVLGESVPGVDVEHEADDDSDEEPLPFEDGELAPALSVDDDVEDTDDSTAQQAITENVEKDEIDSSLDDFFADDDSATAEEEIAAVHEDEPEGAAQTTITTEEDVEDRLADFFGDGDADTLSAEEAALEGVAVEHEADDESEEEPLLFDDGELAPALSNEEDEEQPVPALETDEVDEAIPSPELVAGDGDDLLAPSLDVAKEDKLETGAEEALDTMFGEEEESPQPVEMDEQEEVAIETSGAEEMPIQLGDEVISSEVDSKVDELGLEESLDEVDREDALLGVDVETEDDDDSEEEPLPFEDDDGEIAPALLGDDEIEGDEGIAAEAEEIREDFDESFDAVSADEAFEITDGDLAAEPVDDEIEVDDQFEEITAEEEFAEGEDEEALEKEVSAERFEEIPEERFEEIPEDEIEEIPEEAIDEFVDPVSPALADDTSLELLAEEEDYGEEDEEVLAMLEEEPGVPEIDVAPAFAETVEESEKAIPELSPDELEAVLLEGTDVAAAGEVPAGYPSEDELLREYGEVAGDSEITHPEDNEDYIIAVEGDLETAEAEEEEVVFEAVEEELLVGEDEPLGDVDDDEEYTFSSTLLAEQPPVADDGMLGIELEDEPPSVAEIEEEADLAYVAPDESEIAEDRLSGLRSCIASLGLEIDDNILSNLTDEIENLRHELLDKPSERTFVQLLSTITEHIEKYRYEADADANKLLLSVLDKLDLCSDGSADASQIQEAILTETSKVLQWQQKLIDRAPTEKSSDETEKVDQKLPIADLDRLDEKEKEISVALEDLSRKVDTIGDDLLMKKVTTLMKSELEELKSAFQTELEELKEEMLRRKK